MHPIMAMRSVASFFKRSNQNSISTFQAVTLNLSLWLMQPYPISQNRIDSSRSVGISIYILIIRVHQQRVKEPFKFFLEGILHFFNFRFLFYFFFFTNINASINLSVEIHEGSFCIIIKPSNTKFKGLHLITKNGKGLYNVI